MTRFLFASLFLVMSGMAQAQDIYDNLYSAIRTNDVAALTAALESGTNANIAGPRKATLLHDAALIGSVEAMKILIAHGAGVNAQDATGATPLMWAAGNRSKVQLLLDNKADVRMKGARGITALHIATMYRSAIVVVRLLVAHGADVAAADSQGLQPLHNAALGGDAESVAFLLDKGADVNAEFLNGTPLLGAVVSRQTAVVKVLLARGAKLEAAIDGAKQPPVKNGPIDLGGETPLIMAVHYGPVDMVKLLLDAGANINAKDGKGFTPLMHSVATDHQNADIIRLLLARGADPVIKNRDGYTALTLAHKNGAATGIRLLGGTVPKPAPVAVSQNTPELRDAVIRSIQLLDKTSSSTFLTAGGCVACHAQQATQIAFTAASSKGILVGKEEAEKREQLLRRSTPPPPFPASGEQKLYLLEAFRSIIGQRDGDQNAASLIGDQEDNGSWRGRVPRTPIQDGDFTLTGLALRAIARLAPPSMQQDAAKSLEKGKRWLLAAKPVTVENHSMRLVGLQAGGANTSDVQKAARVLLNLQRPDGGWAQREELASDAYATGIALWALSESGVTKPSDQAYQRGVRFLQSTQAADGSWYVKSRAVITFQPYFESGFPYEHDQWISSMATAWATTALARAVEVEAPKVAQK